MRDEVPLYGFIKKVFEKKEARPEDIEFEPEFQIKP